MATVTKIATAAASAAGSPFNGSWTNEQLARVATSDLTAAGSNTYATAAPGKNQEFASVWPFAFDTTDIPDGSTINAVSVKVQWRSSSTTSASATSSAFVESTQTTALSAVPGVTRTFTTANTDLDDTYSLSTLPTLSQLRSGIYIRVQALRGNTNTAMTASLDYIQVTVTYSTVTTVSGSITADSVLKNTVNATPTADAVIKGPVTATFTADAVLGASGSANIVHRQHHVGWNATGGTTVVNTPTSTPTQGDTLVATIVWRDTSGTASDTITPDTGFTEITSVALTEVDSSGTAHIRSKTYEKVAGASEPASYTFTISASRQATLGLLEFYESGGATLTRQDSVATSGTSTTISASTGTRSSANQYLAGFMGHRNIPSATVDGDLPEDERNQTTGGTNAERVRQIIGHLITSDTTSKTNSATLGTAWTWVDVVVAYGVSAGPSTVSGSFSADAVLKTTSGVYDPFTRTVTDSLGQSDIGSYILDGPAAQFDVTGTAATINMPTAGDTRGAALPQARRVDGSIRIRFQLNKSPASSGTYGYSIFVVPRYLDANNKFQAEILIKPDNTIWLGFAKHSGGVYSSVAAEVQVTRETFAASTYFNVEVVAIGNSPTALKAKVWRDGTSKPTTWDVETTHTDTNIAYGGIEFRDRLDAGATNAPVLGTWDDLDAGVAFLADAVLKATQSSTFTADAVLAGVSGTVGSAFTADAVIKKTYEGGGVPADAVLKATANVTFTGDAVLKKTSSATFTADAVLRKTVASAFTADAVLLRSATSTFTADAYLVALRTSSFFGDAVLKKTATSTFSADAYLVNLRTGTFTADAVIRKTVASSFIADSVIRNTVTGSFSANAVIKGSVSGSFTSDAVLLRTQAVTFTGDAVLKATQPVSFSADAYLVNLRTGSFTADSVLRSTTAATFTADAYINSAILGTFTANTVLRSTVATTFTADAVLLRVNTGSVTADAVIKAPIANTFSANAVIKGTIPVTLTADAVVKATQTSAFSADSRLLAVVAGTVTADARLLAIVTVTWLADAVLKATTLASFSADAVLRATTSATFTADAIITSSQSIAFTGDAVIQQIVGSTVTADAVITDTVTVTLTADAVLLAITSQAFSSDAVLRITADSAFTADAIVSITGTPVWTTPGDSITVNDLTPTLAFMLPSVTSGDMYFEIQLDTVDTFDSPDLQTFRTYPDATGWEIWDSGSWISMPLPVPASYVGAEARFTIPTPLVEGVWYRRVRGGV